MDQWGSLHFWRAVEREGLSFGALLAQHNEHRIFFPRLVFLADLAWFDGRNVLNLAVIGLIQLVAAGLYMKAAVAGRSGALGLLAAALAATMMFSLMQWENLFWGFQVQFVGVFAAGAWAIWLFCSAIADRAHLRWGYLAGAFALLVVATLTLSNGLLAGLAMALAALVGRNWRMALAALGAALALLGLYLLGYHPVEGHSPASLALEQPLKMVAYVCAYLGNIWAGGHAISAVVVGMGGVLATGAMALLLLRDRSPDPVRLALFGIVLFIGMTAAITGLGRLSFGVGQALSSRYVTPVGHFWAAHAVFWALTMQPWRARWPRRALGVVAIAAGLMLVHEQRLGQAQLFAVHERVLTGSSALLGGLADAEATGALFPDPAFIADLLPFMRREKLSLFAEPPVGRPGARLTRPIAEGACIGFLDLLEPAPQSRDIWRAKGWGWDSRAARPIERVVLVDPAGRILGIGLGGVRRDDVARAVGKPAAGLAGWTASLQPGSAREVVAYGLTAGGACEIGRKVAPG